jgi:hypothetical protein
VNANRLLPERPFPRPAGILPLALRLMLSLVLLFTATISLLRLPLQDASPARLLLTPPDGCPMPCWQGIRPGLTTADEALSILRQHAWRGRIALRYFDAAAGDGIISWLWDDPSLDSLPAYLGVQLRVRKGVVWNVTLPPDIPYSEVWFAFGRPSESRWSITNLLNSPHFRIEREAVYAPEGLTVNSRMRCPAKLEDLWQANSTIQLGEPVYRYTYDPVMLVSHDQGDNLRTLLHNQAVCSP